MSVIEIIGFLFGVISVWLLTRESIWNWPVGLVNLVAYIVVFYQARLYAGMGLQVIYVLVSLYGWYHWLRGGPGAQGLRVARAPRAALLVSLGIGGLACLMLGALLDAFTDAALPFLDGALSAFSLVAQWLQARKWLESWHLWIAVDVFYVGMYLVQRLYLTALLYAVFLVLAVIGLRAWRANLVDVEPVPAGQPVPDLGL